MRLFGTDGLRGAAGAFPLDPASVRLLGREVGKRILQGSRGKVVLGGDTRESTEEIVAQLAAGFRQAGCPVEYAGVIPTPAVAELVVALRAGAGISVSASHNPYADNGIKIFGPDGKKWPDAEEESLEEKLLASRTAADSAAAGSLPDPAAATCPDPAAASSSAGRETPPPVKPDLAERYLSLLAHHVPLSLAGFSVLLDTGNGAAFRVGPEALRRAGAQVSTIHASPDGRNINSGCGALHPAGMASETRARGMAMGAAFDGDADRSIFSDETGRILDGDDVLWILARDWKRKGLLSAGGAVGTVMSNWGLEAALAQEGIPFHRAAVGDRNVARLMEQTGATIGGETSGHILQPFSPSGDGILTTLLLAAVVSEARVPLSQLATLQKTPQVLRSVKAHRRVSLDGNSAIGAAVSRSEDRLGDRGRVFLRFSGTEPLLRILVEGRDEKEVAAIADELEKAAKEALA